jgi:hypothetical protein
LAVGCRSSLVDLWSPAVGRRSSAVGTSVFERWARGVGTFDRSATAHHPPTALVASRFHTTRASVPLPTQLTRHDPTPAPLPSLPPLLSSERRAPRKRCWPARACARPSRRRGLCSR